MISSEQLIEAICKTKSGLHFFIKKIFHNTFNAVSVLLALAGKCSFGFPVIP